MHFVACVCKLVGIKKIVKGTNTKKLIETMHEIENGQIDRNTPEEKKREHFTIN